MTPNLDVGKCTFRDPSFPVCDDCVLEAWERMMTGGCGVGASYVNHEPRPRGFIYTRESVRVVG